MERPVLAYLDLLCSALIARDQSALSRLSANPAAASLPDSVRREISECRRQAPVRRGAPIHTLHLYYQYLQLSRCEATVTADHDSEALSASRTGRPSQMELPLFAA